MLLRLINLFYFGGAGNIFINLSLEYFAESFCLMCYNVYFLDFAAKAQNPALWAGMGRAIALPMTALSANLFGLVRSEFSVGGFLTLYVAVLGMLNILFYSLSFRETRTTPIREEANAEVYLPPPADSVAPQVVIDSDIAHGKPLCRTARCRIGRNLYGAGLHG